MQSKLTAPLVLGIVATIGFNLSPIVFGAGMMMNACFVAFAGVVFVLSCMDRRVLGYATVLTACNLAGSLANLSFSFMLAVLTIVKEAWSLPLLMQDFGKRRWWRLYVAALLFVVLSVPFWPADLRQMATEVKNVLSRLGYLVALPLAVGLTLRNPRDGIRVVSLLCLMSVALLAGFYFYGNSVANDVGDVERHIGQIYLGYGRTGVCIPLATLAAGCLALGVSTGFSYRSLPFYVAMAICIFMIMQLGSTGSAFSMVCGMGGMALAYFGVRLSLGRIVLGSILFSIIGSAMFFAVFRTDNVLSRRIDEKNKQMETSGIDRMQFWEEGLGEISKAPLGEGWSTRTGHSDYLLFLLSYGWATGFLYIMAAVSLFLSMWRTVILRTSASPQSRILVLVGLATLPVYLVNSVLDMPASVIGNYQTIWALILTSATVAAVADAASQAAKKPRTCSSPQPFVQQYRRP